MKAPISQSFGGPVQANNGSNIVNGDLNIYPSPPPPARTSSFCLVISCFDGAGLGPELVFPFEKRLFCPFGEYFFFQPQNDEKIVVFWRMRPEGDHDAKLGALLTVLCRHFGTSPCVVTFSSLPQRDFAEHVFVPQELGNWVFSLDQFRGTLRQFNHVISQAPPPTGLPNVVETILRQVVNPNAVSLLVVPQIANLDIIQTIMRTCVAESLGSQIFAHQLQATVGTGCYVRHQGNSNVWHTVGSILGLCKASVGSILAEELVHLLVKRGSVEVYLETKSSRLLYIFLETLKTIGLLKELFGTEKEVEVKEMAKEEFGEGEASWDVQTGIEGDWQSFLTEFEKSGQQFNDDGRASEAMQELLHGKEVAACSICSRSIKMLGDYQICQSCSKMHRCERCLDPLGKGVPFTSCSVCHDIYGHVSHANGAWTCRKCAANSSMHVETKPLVMDVVFGELQKSIDFAETDSVGEALDRIMSEFQLNGERSDFTLIVIAEDLNGSRLEELDDFEARLRNLELGNGDSLELRMKEKRVEEQEDAQNLIDTRDLLAKLSSVSVQLRHIAANVFGAESLLVDLEGAIAKARETRVRWVFVGDLGVGKSGLINQIVMGTPLPSRLSAHSVTKHITEVAWGDSWTISVDDATWTFKAEIEVHNWLLKLSEKEEQYPVVRVSGPFPGLQNLQDVVLVDTPGIGSQKQTESRFLECIRSASVLMIVSARLSSVSVDSLLRLGMLNGQSVPSVIACGVFAGDLDDPKIATELFRASLQNSVVTLVQPEGTVLETWRRVSSLTRTALVFFRNHPGIVDEFVESVRKVCFNLLLTNINECFSTLWFFLNNRMSNQRGAKESKQRRARLDRLLKKMRSGMDSVWSLPSEIEAREAQCRLAWHYLVAESRWGVVNSAEAWQQLRPLLDDFCKELVACGRDAIDAGADWAERMFKRKQGGPYGTIMMEEEEEETEEDETIMPLLLRRKGAEFFNLTRVWEKCQSSVFVCDSLLEALRNEESEDDEGHVMDCFRALITRPCLDILRKEVFAAVDEVRKWALKEFDESLKVAGKGGERRAELKEILTETKGLFVNYMLREHDLILPRTTLANADPPIDNPETIRTVLNANIGDDTLSNRWKKTAKPVFRLVAPEICKGRDDRVLNLAWSDADLLTVRLCTTQTGWNDLKTFADGVCAAYTHNPRATSSPYYQAKYISPIFCFTMVDRPGEVGTVRCKDLFQSHDDAHLANWLMVYVIYEDQLDWYRELTNKSTFILTMPRDAILMVGQDAVKMLCEQLQLPFRWSIPAFLSSTSMFHKNVMRARVCSPASMFYHVENGQLGPLMRDTLKQIANLFEMPDNTQSLLSLVALQPEVMPLVGQFANGAQPFQIWNVQQLIGVLKDPKVHALRNRLIDITASMYLIAEVQVRHGMKFLVNYLQNKDGVQRNFRMRTSRSTNTGVVLSNVVAQQPFSHFWGNYTWKGEHLREGRPETEEEFRKRQTECCDKLLSSCGKAGLPGLFNDQYMWTGVVSVQQRRTGPKAPKTKRPKKDK